LASPDILTGIIAAVVFSASPTRLVLLVCTAQVLAQIGAYTWPALLPGMMPLWKLTYSEAGWITGVFYAAYTLSVPVLVTLTDRIDAKIVYLCGVALTIVGHLVFATFVDGFWGAILARGLAGIGWAGTYMTGLKLLADRVDDHLLSRAAAGHAAGVGIAGALSFVFADLLQNSFGWSAAFAVAAGCAALAWLLIAICAPSRTGHPQATTKGVSLFDFRPVFRNRSAMAYALAYCFHTWEMNALRGWGVVFLAYVAVQSGDGGGWMAPTVVVTVMALMGTVASFAGNEASIRFGRRRLICFAMAGSILVGATIGFVGPLSYTIAVMLVLVYGNFIWLDSASLTAGTAGSADPARRGATLAVHSMLGYTGGFIGPLAIGWTLDLAGGMSSMAWGLAFSMVAGMVVLSLAAFLVLRPSELAGDQNTR
jgi:MFS family permease